MNTSILCAFLVLEIGTTLKQKNGEMCMQVFCQKDAKYMYKGNQRSKNNFEKIKLQGFKIQGDHFKIGQPCFREYNPQ